MTTEEKLSRLEESIKKAKEIKAKLPNDRNLWWSWLRALDDVAWYVSLAGKGYTCSEDVSDLLRQSEQEDFYQGYKESSETSWELRLDEINFELSLYK